MSAYSDDKVFNVRLGHHGTLVYANACNWCVEEADVYNDTPFPEATRRGAICAHYARLVQELKRNGLVISAEIRIGDGSVTINKRRFVAHLTPQGYLTVNQSVGLTIQHDTTAMELAVILLGAII